MKKVLGLCLVIAMCAGLFTACSGNKNGDGTTTAAPTTKEAVTDSTAAQANVTDNPTEVADLSTAVKTYIKNGQNEIPEVGRLKWSDRFLEAANLTETLKEYLKNGGKSSDIKAAAEYVTENAPVPENWKDLFTQDFNEEYKEYTIAKYDDIGNNSYTVYVNRDGKEVEFVTVNARTGYYHG